MLKNDRYIGGGRVFFTPVGGAEVEIGEVQDATLSFNVETAEAFSKDQTMKLLVAKVAKGITATVKFTTQILNANNMAMAMFGTESTKTFEIGDTLPDNTVASAQVVIPFIEAGSKPIIEGMLKFIGDEDGDEKPILEVHHAFLTPTGDIGYIMDDYSKLSFEGAVMKTSDGYAKEYRMTVA